MSRLNQKSSRLVVSICMTALVLRLGALFLLPEPHLDEAAISHLKGAQILLDGSGFADPSFPLITAPLYTVFLALCSFLVGHEQLTVKIAQAVVDSLTVAIIYMIAREIFGAKTAFVSSCGWTVYPFAIYPTIYVGSEALFTFFVSLLVLVCIYSVKSSNWRVYGATGAVLALATLTRGTTQFLPFVLPIVLYLMCRPERPPFKGYLSFIFSFVLVLAPWSLRNYIVLNEIIPVTTSGGMVLLWGATEELFTIDEREKALPVLLEIMQAKGVQKPAPTSGPGEKANFLGGIAIERYKMRLHDDPASIIPFILKKSARLWFATESGKNQGIILAANGPVYILAISGLLLGWKKKVKWSWLLIGIIAYFVAIHIVTLPLFRYMVPVMPCVIVFAAFGLVAFLEGVRAKLSSSQPAVEMDAL